jgi:hypothetical protein
MDATDNTGKPNTPKQATAPSVATDRPFGPDGATILATEHWSLLGTRSLIWNEAMSRTTVFLTVLSAAIVALALLADATGFGRRTTAVALVLLPVVFLLGLATYGRLVQINSEDVAITLAMNRLRYAYLVMAPDLGPYFSTGHHDDERGIATTHLLGMGSDLQTSPTAIPAASASSVRGMAPMPTSTRSQGSVLPSPVTTASTRPSPRKASMSVPSASRTPCSAWRSR